MVLSDRDIEWAMEIGELGITPLPPGGLGDRINPASIDLLLDREILVPQNGSDFTVDLDRFSSSQFIERHSERIEMDDRGYVIEPGGFVVGRTVETVKFSPRLAGRIEGRSRFARLGIGVHVTAPRIDPGFEGAIVLEIFNLGKHRCRLVPNLAIASLLIEWLTGPARQQYQGQFQHQGEQF